ncbi:YrhB domain-containing protein [Catenulispora rubra]|uniref:YrhB domain-containing protein n=1 Tax=Catenulispora rubra TaxID=280293 RepID=UPI0018923CD2|nr:YrhB domain-containing protein [Catenulispora rubra]
MISREWAVELVERRLLAEWESVGSVRSDEPSVVAGVEQHELGWLIGYNTRRFVETGDVKYMLVGNAPFLVDGLDGGLHRVVPWMCEDFLEWPDQYREKVRGEVPPRALDAEVSRLAGLGRRFDAFKAVRAAGDFGPVDARRYVDAVAAGMEPPSDLLALLPQQVRQYSAVATLSGPNPEPEGWSVVRALDGQSDRIVGGIVAT